MTRSHFLIVVIDLPVQPNPPSTYDVVTNTSVVVRVTLPAVAYVATALHLSLAVACEVILVLSVCPPSLAVGAMLKNSAGRRCRPTTAEY